MAAILADSSIWIDYFRRGLAGDSASLDRLLVSRQIVMCGPVAAELLAGTTRERRDNLWRLLAELPWAELDHDGWQLVGNVAADLRSQGAPVPLTDIQIAVVGLRFGAAIWSRDSDFQTIARVLPGLTLVNGPDVLAEA